MAMIKVNTVGVSWISHVYSRQGKAMRVRCTCGMNGTSDSTPSFWCISIKTMGMGSCTKECHDNAIQINDGGYSEIDHKKCIGCGRCVAVCPKKILKRIPATAKVYVACSNHQRGKDVKAVCKKGCLGCGLCAKICPSGAIEMVDNLPVIDYSKCTGCGLCAGKCPVKCIVKIDE